MSKAATKTHLFRLTEEENVELIRRTATKGIVLDLAFGPGWAALEWNEGEPMPDAVRELAAMRGVFTNGTDGDGI